jgi:hypothetical protein
MSTLRTNTLSNAAGSASVPVDTVISGSAKAWVNFDGTGTFSPNPSTTKIRAAFNVTSITDNGLGDYTVTFTTALADANYAVIVTGDRATAPVGSSNGATNTALSASVRTQSGTTSTDSAYVFVAVFR